jgi:hypothetical protein
MNPDILFGIISWIGTILISIGLWKLGKKERQAFLFTFTGELFILVYSLHIHSSSLVFIGLLFSFLAAKNWIAWGKTGE